MSAREASPTVGAEQEHAAPHRGKASLPALWTGLLLAPGAFFVQLAVETPLLSQACYPRDEPLQAPLAATAQAVLAVDVIAILVTLAAFLIARHEWRRTADEKPGGHERLIASGDGRSRFMAMTGMLASAMVAIAVVYVLLNHVVLRVCGI